MEAIIDCAVCGHAVAAHGDDGCHEDTTCKLTQAQAAETVPNQIEGYEKKLSAPSTAASAATAHPSSKTSSRPVSRSSDASFSRPTWSDIRNPYE